MFKVVFIPAETSKALEEWEVEIPPGQDIPCLVDRVKKHFNQTNTSLDTEKYRQQVMSQLPKGTELTQDLINAIMMMDSLVDTIPLLVNKKEAGYIGVNMYVDDRGSAKGLPVNIRASSLAAECGKPTQVLGDAFVGRVFDNDDDFKRLDFTLADLDTSSDWFQKAKQLNALFAAGGASTGRAVTRVTSKDSSKGQTCSLTDCDQVGSLRCSRCKQAHYCSKEHQVAHWKEHKRQCQA